MTAIKIKTFNSGKFYIVKTVNGVKRTRRIVKARRHKAEKDCAPFLKGVFHYDLLMNIGGKLEWIPTPKITLWTVKNK